MNAMNEDIGLLALEARWGSEVLADYRRVVGARPSWLGRIVGRASAPTLPLALVERIGAFWGNRNHHAKIFRTPQGLRFVHCWDCALPMRPSRAGFSAPLPSEPITAENQQRICQGVRKHREAT